MLRSLIGFVDRLVRGATYVSVLIIGLSVAVLGVYLVTLLCYRVGQFAWDSVLGHRWGW